jgi:hypothetical protein
VSKEVEIGSIEEFIFGVQHTIHLPHNDHFFYFKFNLNTYLICTCTKIIIFLIKK